MKLFAVLDSQCKIKFITTSLSGAQQAAQRKGISEVFEFISPSTVQVVCTYQKSFESKNEWVNVDGDLATKIDVAEIVLSSIYSRDVQRHFS